MVDLMDYEDDEVTDVKLAIVDFLDELVIGGKIDIEKYPIPDVYLKQADRYMDEVEDVYAERLAELEAERDYMEEQGHDTSEINIRIADTIGYAAARETEIKLDCETQWKYKLASEFFKSRERFLDNLFAVPETHTVH